jgi:hypothetical protein
MAAAAQGDQQIRPVVAVAMMDHQRRTLATTTAAEPVPLQYALAQSTENNVASDAAGHSMSGSSRGLSARFACHTNTEKTN